LLSLDEAWKRF
jgi:hypothetical protein